MADDSNAITREQVPGEFNELDREGLYARFDDQDRLRLYAFYVQGECRASLSLDPDRAYGRFEGGHAGEIYSQHTVELMSPWHDNASAKPTDQSLAEWAEGYLQVVLAIALRNV